MTRPAPASKAERQKWAQSRAEPHIARAYAQMIDQGLEPHEAAQALILAGAGALARALGPDGAGHHLRDLADAHRAWLIDLAETVEGAPTLPDTRH